MNEQIVGAARPVVVAAVSYLVGAGIIPTGSADLIVTAVLAVGAAAWSWRSNSKSSLVAKVAAMPETKVEGNKIVIKDSELATAAQVSATPNTAGDLK